MGPDFARVLSNLIEAIKGFDPLSARARLLIALLAPALRALTCALGLMQGYTVVYGSAAPKAIRGRVPQLMRGPRA